MFGLSLLASYDIIEAVKEIKKKNGAQVKVGLHGWSNGGLVVLNSLLYEGSKDLESISPFHKVREHLNLPPTFFLSSTNDDRVNPVHSRKMVAKIEDSLRKNCYFYEFETGGHGLNSNSMYIKKNALVYNFFSWSLLRNFE